MTDRLVVLVALSSAAAFACSDDNISGRLGALAFGDVSNPPAARTDGRSILAEACGAPANPIAIDPHFARRPYLQHTTSTSQQLVWVSATGASSVALVSASDGTEVTTTPPVRDGSAHLLAGQSQWTSDLGELAPDTTYCYEIRDDGAATTRAGFSTPPAAGAGGRVRILAFGDSGSATHDQAALLEQMRTVDFDLMLHTGDIAYQTGTRAELQQNFFDSYADLLADHPMFPASGNHDYETEDAAPFREAFRLPENGGPEGLERWYSFDWGDVHFVALDTERIGPVQAQWLDDDLGRNSLPWTIVYGHRPPFSSGSHGSDGNFRTHFLPVIEKHHVPLVLTGHDHHYERSTPQNGVVHVVTGGGGRGVREVGWSSFTAFDTAVIHFVYITIEGDQLALHAIDGLGQEFDSLVLTRT
jgi:3',5'-cyclic AMP phosphodiesterase CpdA